MYTNILDYNYQQLLQEIDTIKYGISQLPEGECVCTKNGNYIKSYIKKDGSLEYIPSNKSKLAEELAYKKYIINKLEILQKLQQKFQELLGIYEQKQRLTDMSQGDNPKRAYYLLANKYIEAHKMQDDYLSWAKEDYEKNEFRPENLIHKTADGLLVRSKSEALIAVALREFNIPFRYECKLDLAECAYYPDFTVIDMKYKRTLYWEHFGMMDNSDYVLDFQKKIRTYINNGIVPGNNLLTTYETRENPLDYETICNIIRVYLVEDR